MSSFPRWGLLCQVLAHNLAATHGGEPPVIHIEGTDDGYLVHAEPGGCISPRLHGAQVGAYLVGAITGLAMASKGACPAAVPVVPNRTPAGPAAGR